MSSEHARQHEDVLEGTPYRALARIGSGGMGDIYDAIGARDERVAVKLLRADLVGDPALVDRMRLEGQVLGLFSHPNIVATRSFGTTAAGRPYIAMERLDGPTMQQELRRRRALPIA